MSYYRSILCVAVMGVLAFGISAQAIEPAGTAGLRMIPQDQIGEIQYLTNEGPIAGLDDPTYVYNNQSPVYMSLRVPDSAAGPGTMWLGDDFELELPNGTTDWDITSYGYMTYAFSGTAPYDVHSALMRFDACTSAPEPLLDWWTGDCCVAPAEIAGTAADFTIPFNGMVWVNYALPAVVNIERDGFMFLSYAGANVAGNAGWIIAYDCNDPCDVGFTDDFWAEEIDGVGCGAFWFGGDPWSGFAAYIKGESAAVMDVIPTAISGAGSIVGNVAYLDCNDLPQDVQFEVFARDWGGEGNAVQVKGYQDKIGCDSYYTAGGTLTAINYDCSLFGDCDPFTMGISQAHPDIIWNGGYPACNNSDLCPDAVNGAYSCLNGGLIAVSDSGAAKYLNQYAFTVGADVQGFFEISLDCETLYTQLSDPTATPIVPLARNSAFVGVQLGRCCYTIGPGTTQCTDSVTDCYCDTLPGAQVWDAGLFCGAEGDDPPYGCPSCLVNEECADGDSCTIDTCVDFVCYHDAVVLDADECCDPTFIDLPTDVGGLGAQASNNDGDPCTTDECDAPGTCAVGDQCGAPINPIDPGARCCELQPDNPAKAVACTYNDTCNFYCFDGEDIVQPLVVCDPGDPGAACGAGTCEWGCHGIDVNTVSCGTDDDCIFDGTAGMDMGVGAPCGPQAFPCKDGFCYCAETTRIWLDVLDADCCFEEGDAIEVVVRKTAGADNVTGAQFAVTYDPDCVNFLGYDMGDYTLPLYADVTPGMIFLAYGWQPFDPNPGTAGPAVLGYLHFQCAHACEMCQICLFNQENPPNTVLVNDAGEHVTMVSWGCSNNGDACEVDADCEEGAYCGCTCMLTQLGDEMIVTPDDVLTNSDCMAYTAVVTWDTPAYWISECGFDAELECYGIHDPYVPEDQMSDPYIEGLIEGGGEFAQGVTTFCCEAVGLCDFPITECWTVEVTDQNAMDVIVEYSPPMAMGPYVRGIVFELFKDCYNEPIVECKDLTFGPPFDFVGKATEVLKVPKTQLMCVTAADPLHTLRSVDMPIECVGNALVVQFHGDPDLGGNWLINGNLDGNHHIDIVDFGIFLSQYMMAMAADTPCGTGGPNADINGDGVVNSADFAHIAMNFITESKDACCDDPTVGWKGEPTMSITVKELRRLGMADLTVADLNGDGVLDQADMTAFMQGTEPVAPVRDVKRSSVRSLGR